MFGYKIFQSWLFYFMLAHFSLLVFLVAINARRTWEEVKKIDKKIWLLLLVIFLYGFWVRNAQYWLGPHTDGYVAQESAHLWVLHGQFVKSCALGTHADCQLFEQVLAPPGFPFLIALAHLVFGIHSLNASVISAILSSLTILLAFLIAYLVFKKEEAGLYAALVFSLIPLNIINSQSGEARPAGLFFAGLALLLFILAQKNGRPAVWLAWLASLSYAIYIRQESYVLVPFFLFFLLVFNWPRIKSWFLSLLSGRPDFKGLFMVASFALFFIILQLPVLHWLLFNNPYSTYQGGKIGFLALSLKTAALPAWAFFLQFFNLSPLGSGIWHYDLLVSLVFLAAAALLFSYWKEKEHWLPWGFFGAYFLVYCMLFDGNISGTGALTGDYYRRSLMFHLPMAIIAGWGFYSFNPMKGRRFLALNLLLVFLAAASFNVISYFPFSKPGGALSYFSGRMVSREQISSVYFPGVIFQDARADKKGDRSLIYPPQDYWMAIGRIPNGCLIITSQHIVVTSDYFKDNRRQTASLSLVNDETEHLFLREVKKNECLVYIGDRLCSDPLFADRGCRFLRDNLEKKELLFTQGLLSVYKMKVK